MVTLSDDEIALIRQRSSPKESLLTALRGIKVRDIDKDPIDSGKSRSKCDRCLTIIPIALLVQLLPPDA